MTQAFNLAQFANNLNTAGQAAAGTSLSGAVPIANGGTNLTTAPTNGQLLIGNGTGYVQAALTAGSNITITNGAGTITVAATAAAPSTTDVLNATAGATAGAVGTYAFLSDNTQRASNTIVPAGTTVAGSNLRLASMITLDACTSNVAYIYPSTTPPSGTWRLMGIANSNMAPGFSNLVPRYAAVFLRIS